jgi:AcrR family transcriptional regulator
VKKPKTKRGEESLLKISQAAEKLFIEKGYYNTEIHDITKSAGLSVGTFYIYFPNKLSCFQHLLQVKGKLLRQEIRVAQAGKSHAPFMELEKINMEVFFNFVMDHPGLFALVWQSQYVDPKSFYNYYDQFCGGYVKQILTAQANSEIKSMDPTSLAYCLMGIYNFLALKYVVMDGKKPNESIFAEVQNFIDFGIANKRPET